jgi:hypothetical protein
MVRRSRVFAAALAVVGLLVGVGLPRAEGYEERIHSLLEERALPGEVVAATYAPATLEDADALRRAVWRAGAQHPDASVRQAFLRRYPAEESFDRWAWKELLGFAPEADVYGIDRLPPMPAEHGTVGALMAAGAAHPDLDRRNQERFAHDAARHVRLDPWGAPLPFDPAQLDMGPLRGTPSQAYAHYGLPKGERSDSTDVLKKEPWRWAYPPTARAFAPDYAQELTDLALCAATSGTSGGPALGWLYLAQAHHYVADVANQIHTLQAIYGFFVDAKIESYKQELWSLGGVLRSRPDFVTIGIGIIKNHHLLAENLWAKRVFEAIGGAQLPAVSAGIDRITTGDDALAAALAARKLGPDGSFGQAITEEVIEASCREGGAVYEVIRDLAISDLSRVGGDYDMGKDPDRYLRAGVDAEKLGRFYALEAAGFARAGLALRTHVALYRAALASGARETVFARSAERLVATRMAARTEAEARAAAYQPKPPAHETINWVVPSGALVGLALFVGGAAWYVARVRRRRALA